MSFWSGLLAARAHIAFLLGLGVALTVAFLVENRGPKKIEAGIVRFDTLLLGDKPEAARVPVRGTGRALDARERAWAENAWRYFAANTQEATGLANSAHNYPSTTLWDLGSYAMALLAAEDLGLIDAANAKGRIEKLLASLARMPLVEGKLPNKAYDTRTLAMVDYNNKEAPQGIGWSATDIARLGVPLSILVWRHPEHTPAVRAILSQWHLEEAVAGGSLQGSDRGADGALVRVQEGRFGYEEYAAKSLFLLGQDVSTAMRYDVDVAVMPVSGQNIAYDSRLPAQHDGTHNAVLSEPYILEALELGLNDVTRPIAMAVYRAQEKHADEVGRLVAVSEDNLDRPPYFAYNTVLNDQKPWAIFTPDGKDASAHRTLSTKAAIGWGLVFDDEYARKLLEAGSALVDADKGFYSGRYDEGGALNKAITANTNGIVLEALWYVARGPLLTGARMETRGQ
jgi:hypothetical protein